MTAKTRTILLVAVLGAPTATGVALSAHVAGAAETQAGDAQSQQLSFRETAVPPLLARADGTVVGTVFLQNPTTSDLRVSIQLALRSARGGLVQVPEAVLSSEVVPGSRAIYGVSFTARLPALSPAEFPLTGWLRLGPAADPGGGGSNTFEPRLLEIKTINRVTSGAEWPVFLWAGLLSAAVVVLAGVVGIVCCGPSVLLLRMGPPKWSFTESWSSNLTIAGGFLTSVIGFAGIPEQGASLGRNSYALISLIAAGLVGMAPGVFSLVRRPVQVAVDDKTVDVEYQGIVGMFLIATGFTVAGALIQLGTIRLLLTDLADAGLIAATTADLLGWACLGLRAALPIGAVASLVLALRALAGPKTGTRASEESLLLRKGTHTDAAARPRGALADWPLF